MYRKDAFDLGDLLTILDPIGKNAKSQRLRFRDSFIVRRSVGQDAR